MFSKLFQGMTLEDTARSVGYLGLNGVDLTVRTGGHVLPQEVDGALKDAVATLAQHGLSVPMITTGIVDPDDPTTEPIMQAAADSGVKFIKLGYWQYEGFGHIRDQIGRTKKLLDGIEAAAQRAGVHAAIHIHSGQCLSASAPVVALLLEGRDPKHLGAYVDPSHMTIEGFKSGWVMGLDLLTPWISISSVKSPGWEWEEDALTGVRKWNDRIMPLAMGAVRWPEYLGYLAQIGFDGPMSIHSEYLGGHSWRDLSVEEAVAQTREDLGYLRGVMESVGLEAT